MEHVFCNLCGSNKSRPFLTRTDRFTGKIFQFVSCTECGLIYLNPRPTQKELEEDYPAEYEAFKFQRVTDLPKDIRRLLDIQLNFVEKFIPSRGRLLDIGCATGNFIWAARKRGWDVSGVELIEPAARIAQAHGLNVKIGSLQTVEWADAHYNLITLWDVLEHLPDPKMVLKHCYNLILPNGLLIFSIPNLKSFDRYIFRHAWIGWDAPRHFFMFSETNIIKLLESTGFEILEQKCLLGGKGTFLLSLDFLFSTRKIGSLLKKIYPLISTLLWPYRRFSYFFKRGPIITIVARKVS